jgi:hypothetical protein
MFKKSIASVLILAGALVLPATVILRAHRHKWKDYRSTGCFNVVRTADAWYW